MNPTLANLRRYGIAGRIGKIAPHTYSVQYGNTICVRYHSTEIYTENAGGFTICFDGYTTVTTYARLNAILPDGYHVFQKAYQAYLRQPDGSASKLDHYGLNRINKGYYFPDFGGINP